MGSAKEASGEPDDPPGVDEILVVDDNRANLVAIQAALFGLGGRVVTASSGPEALRRLLERDFALLILDVQMPTMDGFETARLIRARQRSRHTPIIFVTAHHRDDRDVSQAYQLGAVDFLFKPIVPEILRAKATVFLQLQERTREVARQSQLLREHERRRHELELAEARRRWEEDALRRRMESERRIAADMARRADELARTVAELERAERELTRMNRALAEADRRKDEFLAVLAHELRNPLAPIVNSLGVLKLLLGDAPDPGVRRAEEAIERQTRHLTRLVDDLLDLSRINSGKIELRTERLRLNDIVSQAVALAQPSIEQRRHELRVHLLESGGEVVADAVRLAQVLSNLLNNAARYTEPGGVIELTCAQDETHARVTVRDSGRGIPPELLDKVFDMFVQEQSGGGGLGIGLSLVRSLVRLHGGTVTVASDGLNRGSAFTIELPRAGTQQSLQPSELPSPLPPALPRRVVVVDDNQDVRETLGELLRGWGHEVVLAADGAEGVDRILEFRPDVALVDLGLPVLDGYGVALAVRAAQRDAPRTRLIAVSGFGRDADKQRALESGFDMHLVKPAAAEALLRALAYGASSSAPPCAPRSTADPSAG
ncbi:MAG: response regulator [Myxococcales bacterium]|nr:response regulator [Myxococcales bacterium]